MSQPLNQEERERRHQARVAACHVSTFFCALRETAIRGFHEGQFRVPALGDVVIDDDDVLDRVLRKLDRLEAAAKRKAYASGKSLRGPRPRTTPGSSHK